MYGNIVIPDLGKEKPEMGKVVAIGPGRMSEFGKYITVQAKIGEIVLVPKIGTLRFDFEGEEYYIVQDREILATIKEAEENE
jgi:chaperonin GroES